MGLTEDARRDRHEAVAAEGSEDRPVSPMKRAAEALTRLAEARGESTRKIHERRLRGEEPW